jgi:alkanesulfonate monooxygenase SsuD/methylene tetrahydromethanopterin reductase-like flavin-dependent oxidoreductase (luciferase family)
MPLQFGVFDHLDTRAGVPAAQNYADRLRLIEAYDRAGFRTWHLAEHHATPLGLAPSPSVFLGAVAARTTRLRFGPMVYCLPLYEPLRLIEEICMLDHLSGGRFEFGVGRGISPFESAYFGVGRDAAPAIYREAFTVLMQGLTSPELTHHGDRFDYDAVPMVLAPLQRPHPPLWYGVATATGAAWPAEHGVNMISNAPCAIARQATDQYRETWARVHGAAPLPMIGAARHVYIAETRAEAERIAERAYAAWYENFIALWRRHGQVDAAYASTVALARERDAVVIGTPDSVAAEIARQVEAAGLNYFVCRFAYGDLSRAEAAASLALFVDEVMPCFKDKAVDAAE